MSKKIGVLFADGCEEVEGLTVVDLLRRAGLDVHMVSVMGRKDITGSHKIHFFADDLFEDVDFSSYDGLVLPGGIPGTPNLAAHPGVQKEIKSFAQAGKLTAAICAAPTVFGQAGLLQGKGATCYPGLEDQLAGAHVKTDKVVEDANIITSRGVGTAIEFSLSLIKYLIDEQTAEQIRESIVYNM